MSAMIFVFIMQAYDFTVYYPVETKTYRIEDRPPAASPY